jgi:Sulfotransferase family
MESAMKLPAPDSFRDAEGLLHQYASTATGLANFGVRRRHASEPGVRTTVNHQHNLYGARAMFEGVNADRPALGAREARLWRISLDRLLSARENAPDRFFDVRFVDFLADPLQVIHAIYDRFGFTLSAETEKRMRAWIREHPRNQHGVHKYAAEEYGLSAAALARDYHDYIDRFQLQGSEARQS